MTDVLPTTVLSDRAATEVDRYVAQRLRDRLQAVDAVALVLLRSGMVHFIHVDSCQFRQPIGARIQPRAEDDQLRMRFGANGVIDDDGA